MKWRGLILCLVLSIFLFSFCPFAEKTRTIKIEGPDDDENNQKLCSVPNGGFQHLQAAGKRLSRGCEVVILSSTLGNYDRFRPLENDKEEGLCFVFFSDNRLSLPMRNCTPAEGDLFSKERVIMCGGWMVVMEDQSGFPFSTAILNTRVLKTLLHIFFPYAKIVGWIDGNKIPVFTLKDIQELFKNDKTVMALPPRLLGESNIRNESEAVVKLGVAEPERVRQMIEMYTSLGWDGLRAYHGGFRIQRNVPLTRRFACDWFAEIEAWAKRDQLSLSPMLHKHEIDQPPFLQVIPVLEVTDYFITKSHSSKNHGKVWGKQKRRDRQRGTKRLICDDWTNITSTFPSQDAKFINSNYFKHIRQYLEPQLPHIHTGLDLGAGVGSFAATCHRLWGLSVTSMDVNTDEFPFDCVVSARGRVSSAVLWDRGITPYPLLSGLFDLIHIGNFSAPSGPAMKRLAWEWSRLLRPDGVLILSSTMSSSENAAFVVGMEENHRRLVGNEKLGRREGEGGEREGGGVDPVYDYLVVFIGREGGE